MSKLQNYNRNKKVRICNGVNIAVFCSGNGSNFQAIVDASKKGLFEAKVALMVCDNPDAYAIKRAEKEKIKSFIIERANFSSKQKFEERIIQELEKERIELICLAGYMRILSHSFVERYRNRILNIHPAILPLFKGTHGIKDALDYGVKVTGVTVHFVNEDMDAGPIVLQEAVKIEPDDTEESLTEKIHAIEHRLYPEAIRLFTKGRLKVIGRRVKVLTAVAIIFLVFGFDPKAMFDRKAFSPLPPETETMFLKEMPSALLPEIKAIFCREAPPSLPQREKPPVLIAEHRVSIEKGLKLNSTACNKLGLKTLLLYNYTDSNYAELLNPNPNVERPLTEEEAENMRIGGSVKIARAFAEAMDSMNIKFAYNGINGLIDTTMKAIDFRNYIGNKYNLHLKVDKDEALLKYKRRF